jgi:ribokinase
LASWDRLIVVDRYPAAGEYEIVRRALSAPGGTTSNSAMALARLGAEVAIAACIGDDGEGTAMRTALEEAGVDCRWLTVRAGEPTDGATIVVSGLPPERTIYWHQGARFVRGDRLDVAAIFEHDLVLLDVDDAPLRRFLVDLPAHTLPSARLLGTLTYLVDDGPPDAFDLVLRHDVMIGNEREWRVLTGADSLDGVVARVQRAMPGASLRGAVISRGRDGATACTATARWDVAAFAVDAIDTTGAGDAFAAGVAYAHALRWEWPRVLRFANAVGALSTRSLGAQSSLPTLAEVASLLGEDAATLVG